MSLLINFFIGGTGFLGKVLTEKLLRSCPDISKMYLLIRERKNESPEKRLEKLLNGPVRYFRNLFKK